MPASPTRRVNRGRNHSYLLDGDKAPGVTTILKALPKPALVGWAARTVAETAVERQDVWRDMPDGQAIEWLKRAPYSDRDKAANRGSQVHKLAERISNGEEVEVPEELVGHVDAYVAFLEQWQPTDVLSELVVVNRKHRYMGTLDMICTIEGLGRCLIDLKTNRSGPFGEVALQLAAYRYAEVYVDDDGTEHDMPAIDFCGALWLRADGFDLYPYDAGPETFRTFLYVQQVGWWMDNRERQAKSQAIYPHQFEEAS